MIWSGFFELWLITHRVADESRFLSLWRWKWNVVSLVFTESLLILYEANRCRCYLENFFPQLPFFHFNSFKQGFHIRYVDYEIITAHPATMCQDLLELSSNDELFMQTKWCSAIKRAESTRVSCVTLMACLRSIHQSFSLFVCLSAVWLCGASGWAAAPGPGHPWSGGAGGYAAEPGTHHHTRHRFYPVHGLWHLALGHLQRRKRNWNCLLPYHRHRWVPWAWPAAETCNSNPHNPYNTN